MSDQSLWRKRLCQARAEAEAIMKNDGEMTARFVVYHRGRVTQFTTPFYDTTWKLQVFAFLSKMFIWLDADGFVFLTETWVRGHERRHGESYAEMVRRVKDQPVSKVSDRKEALSLSAVYRDDDGERQCLADMGFIDRNSVGVVTTIGWSSLETVMGGAVVKIMPEIEPDAATVAGIAQIMSESLTTRLQDLQISVVPRYEEP